MTSIQILLGSAAICIILFLLMLSIAYKMWCTCNYDEVALYIVCIIAFVSAVLAITCISQAIDRSDKLQRSSNAYNTRK